MVGTGFVRSPLPSTCPVSHVCDRPHERGFLKSTDHIAREHLTCCCRAAATVLGQVKVNHAKVGSVDPLVVSHLWGPHRIAKERLQVGGDDKNFTMVCHVYYT